jgi:archaellum component FlaC
MEDALKRLDKLTQEEARMAFEETLKATHAVDERVAGVDNRVAGIDERVAGVDERIAGVGERVAGVGEEVARVDNHVVRIDNRVAGVDDRVAGVDDQVARVDDNVKGIDASVDQMKRSSSLNLINTDYRALHITSANQIREDIRRWLSPPDPSTNHNIACGAHHKKPATWFFQSSIFREWKSTASLLWIHGKRAPSLTSHLIPSGDILNSSWLRQEYSLVRGCLTLSTIRG